MKEEARPDTFRQGERAILDLRREFPGAVADGGILADAAPAIRCAEHDAVGALEHLLREAEAAVAGNRIRMQYPIVPVQRPHDDIGPVACGSQTDKLQPAETRFVFMLPVVIVLDHDCSQSKVSRMGALLVRSDNTCDHVCVDSGHPVGRSAAELAGIAAEAACMHGCPAQQHRLQVNSSLPFVVVITRPVPVIHALCGADAALKRGAWMAASVRAWTND